MENKFNLRGKRKKCAEMIMEMATVLGWPEEVRKVMIDGMDLTKVSNDQINDIYRGLVALLKQANPEELRRWLERAKEIQN